MTEKKKMKPIPEKMPAAASKFPKVGEEAHRRLGKRLARIIANRKA